MSWTTITSTVILGLSVIYGFLILMALAGLFRLRDGQNQSHDDVSVVVAAKNEAHSIGHCLRALQEQTYPQNRYEVVVVDDSSVDDTALVVRRFAQEDARIRLIASPQGPGSLRGKKRALEAGIQGSRGDIILITDADCRPAPTWIERMVRHFEPQVGLVAGYVQQEGSRFWQKLRCVERLSMAAAAAGAIGWGRGLTATGGNLAYRREVFQQVGGFRDLSRPLSGDDDLFLQLISRRTRWALRYAFEPGAHVDTDPPTTLRAFVAQERRRTSKGLFYPTWIQLVAAEAFLLNLGLAVYLPLALVHPSDHLLPLVAWGIKVVGEFLLLWKASRLFGRIGLLRYVPLVAILYIPYFLLFSIWGTLGSYRWKSESRRPQAPADGSASW